MFEGTGRPGHDVVSLGQTIGSLFSTKGSSGAVECMEVHTQHCSLVFLKQVLDHSIEHI